MELRAALLHMLSEVDWLTAQNDADRALERRIASAMDKQHFDSPKAVARQRLERLDALARDLVDHRQNIVARLDSIYGARTVTLSDEVKE
jgi:ribonuclease D